MRIHIHNIKAQRQIVRDIFLSLVCFPKDAVVGTVGYRDGGQLGEGTRGGTL